MVVVVMLMLGFISQRRHLDIRVSFILIVKTKNLLRDLPALATELGSAWGSQTTTTSKILSRIKCLLFEFISVEGVK